MLTNKYLLTILIIALLLLHFPEYSAYLSMFSLNSSNTNCLAFFSSQLSDLACHRMSPRFFRSLLLSFCMSLYVATQDVNYGQFKCFIEKYTCCAVVSIADLLRWSAIWKTTESELSSCFRSPEPQSVS